VGVDTNTAQASPNHPPEIEQRTRRAFWVCTKDEVTIIDPSHKNAICCRVPPMQPLVVLLIWCLLKYLAVPGLGRLICSNMTFLVS